MLLDRIKRLIKVCYDDISFKDKGLIVIMLILLMQCIHNLFTVEPINVEYLSINVIVRTSVAAIFGYFLSSNFLNKSKVKCNALCVDETKLINEVLDDEAKSEDVNEEESEEKEKREKEACNIVLQNSVAIGMCLIMLVCLIIGLNLKAIPEGSEATIVQFRDLISGCIGFLLGNTSTKSNK